MPFFGPPDIVKLKAKRDVDGLIKALGYQRNAQIRKYAVEALGQIGEARAVPALVNALKDGDEEVAITAARSLGQIGDPQAVEPLLAVLNILGRLGVPAAEALVMIGPPSIQPIVNWLSRGGTEGWKRWTDVLAQIGTPAVDALISLLNHKNAWVRGYAADALGQIGDTRAVKSLIAALSDKADGVRTQAAVALGKIGDKQAIPYLTAALKKEECIGRFIERSPGYYIRISIALALTSLGWQPDNSESAAIYWIIREQRDKCVGIGLPAVKHLIAELDNWYDRTGPVEALTKIGSPAVDALIATLEKDRERRIGAAEALGMIGDVRAIPALVHQLWSWEEGGKQPGIGYEAKDELNARAAVDALVRIGSPAVPFLTAALQEEEKPYMRKRITKVRTLIRGHRK